MGPVHSLLMKFGPAKGHILLVHHIPELGFLDLQPARYDPLDQEPFDRRRVRSEQFFSNGFELGKDRFLDRQILFGERPDE